MRKTWWVLAAVAVVGGGLLVGLSRPGGISVIGVEYGGTDRRFIADRSYDFLEDIQFKDFKTAATYHLAETQKARDIPELIHRVFQVRHELLDIQRYKVLDVDLDRSGIRGRVRTEIIWQLLGDSEVSARREAQRKTELMFYWFKQSDGKWAMELESSLR